MPNPLATELERDGVVILPGLVTGDRLAQMQQAFAGRLRRLRWNNFDGYEQTERFRHLVQDVLVLDQGFVDLAVHPRICEAIREYVGPAFTLVEAKGWKSLPTRRDFHGWHGDAWYDQKTVSGIPREVKLGLYLTDVRSGAFHYVRGSHGTQAPRSVRNSELGDVAPDRILEVKGSAGTAFLFDTSGIHRQGMPILEERRAVFYNYHDPSVPLQGADVDYYRYHPLLLNAAFLGNLTEEDRRILDFGNKINYIPGFERQPEHVAFQSAARVCYHVELRFGEFSGRVVAKLQSLLKRAGL